MQRALVLLALGASACAEPVVELSLRLPSADRGGTFNTSCVTAVDVYTNGAGYPDTDGDYVRGCVELSSSPATFFALKTALVGKIDVQLPPSGLSSVELFGRHGGCSQDSTLPPGDLVFYAGSAYIGDDQLVLPIDAISSCEPSSAPVVVRPIDLLALTTGPMKGVCAAAAALDGPDAGADIGTIAPTVASGMVWHSGAGAGTTQGVATIHSAVTTVGPTSCLAVAAGDQRFGSLSCVDRNAPTACAAAGEIEAPGIDGEIALASIDQARKNRFPGLVFGAVVNGQRLPVQGATVEIDPDLGEVVYVELTAGRLAPIAGTSTGTSGLFLVYTNALATVKITAGALSRTTTMGAISDSPAGALIVLR
ncbi:MAG: hypothetical protein JWP01_2650 [Myxococcales bacterium]|nr:hypothetical protein [Myxococcales bacterium]